MTEISDERLAEIAAIPDDEIDTSDIPEATAADFWRMRRPRPADLGEVMLQLDWKTITISGVDEAGLGRIFMWLLGQVQGARDG